jgi:hypothetical protein
MDKSVDVMEFQATDAYSNFGSYKDGIQNTQAMNSGERRGNITNQTKHFKPSENMLSVW